MKNFLLTVVAVGTIFGAGMLVRGEAAGTQEAGRYEVVIGRAERVGEETKRAVVVETDWKTQGTFGGKVLKEEKTRIVITVVGKVRVTAVDAGGQMTGGSVSLEKCERAENGKVVASVPAGGVVEVKAKGDGGYAFFEGTSEVPKREGELLSSMFYAYRPDGNQDDLLMNGGNSRKIGETWEMNVAAGQKDMERLHGKSGAKLEGMVQLLGTRLIAGQDCLEVRVKMRVSGGQVPEGASAGVSELDVDSSLVLPVDSKQPLVSRTTTRDAHYGYTEKDGTRVVSQMHQVERESREWVTGDIGKQDKG